MQYPPVNIMPLVSIIIPCFNVKKPILEEALHSIMMQTLDKFECIIIDESTDPQKALACKLICESDHRFKYIVPDKKIGLAGSLNLGISIARSKFIARFDADDICLPDRLESQFKYLMNNLDIDILGGSVEVFNDLNDNNYIRKYPIHHDEIERKFQLSTPIAHPTIMIRKNVLNKYGKYNNLFKHAEDLELWLRLLNKGVRFSNMDKILVKYRQDSILRSSLHWKFNLKARIDNFQLKYFFRRVIGIFAIKVYSLLPNLIQKKLFFLHNLKRK